MELVSHSLSEHGPDDRFGCEVRRTDGGFITFKNHPQGSLQMKSNIFPKINVKSALFGVDRKQIKLMYFSQLGFYDSCLCKIYCNSRVITLKKNNKELSCSGR